MDIKTMIAGISENELKGKSLDEQIKLVTKRMKEQKENMEIAEAKTVISNFEKKLPKLIDQLQEPFEIYVKSVGQKKTPTVVSVVGYNGFTKEVIVYLNGKNYPIKQSELVKSVEELANLKTKKSTGGTTKKPKKNTK
jgi:hypothetical protein